MKVVFAILGILAAMAVALSIGWFYLAWSFGGGGGEIVTEERAVAPFNRIVIEGFADVTLVQGNTESVQIEAPKKQSAGVRTQVSGGTLTIAHGQSRPWLLGFLGVGARGAHVRVAFRNLDAIAAAGAVKIRAESLKAEALKVSASGATSLRIDDLDAKELSVSGSGAIKVELAGRAVEQRVSISGAGDYRAADLASVDARVAVSGAGRVVVQVEKTLKVGLSGAGAVEYIGNPKVTQQISGAGRVKRRDAAHSMRIVA